MASWSYDTRINRYRDTTSGKLLAKAAVVKLRDDVVTGATADARALAAQVESGDITPGDFGAEMRKLIKRAHIAQYELGRGGLNAITPADRGAIGRRVRDEYKALDGFIRDLERPDGMSAEAAANRSELYMESSIGSYERGKAAALGVSPPETMPPLHARCRCSLTYKVEGGKQVVYWTAVSGACPECEAMAGMYNPLELEAA